MRSHFRRKSLDLLPNVGYFSAAFHNIAMKRTVPPKSFFFLLAAVSLASFIYVNVQTTPTLASPLPPVSIEKEAAAHEEPAPELPVPDVQFLSRAVELLQKFL